MSKPGMDKKVVVITDASSGIGKATAMKLAKNGFCLALLARREELLNELKASLSLPDSDIFIMKCDVTDREMVKNVMQAVLDKFGKIDVLVNNAGLMPLAGLESITTNPKYYEDWDTMSDVNVKGVINCLEGVIPGMKEKKSGHIINISSVAGVEVFPSGSVYCATKHAVEAITRGIRIKLMKPYNIQATSIRPGMNHTNLLSTVKDEKVSQVFVGIAKNSKILDAEDVANAVLFTVNQPEHSDLTDLTIRHRS